jgi:hypothetical protein
VPATARGGMSALRIDPIASRDALTVGAEVIRQSQDGW